MSTIPERLEKLRAKMQEKGIDIVGAVVDRVVDKDNGSLDMQTFNMLPKLLTFITGNNNDPGKVMLF